MINRLGHNEEILKRLGKTRDELLYDSNSLFFLSENIEILHAMSEPTNLSKEIRRIIFFDIVTKYCQMVESFAAYINAFEESNRNSPSANIIFNHLVKYRVGDILEEFNEFKSSQDEYIVIQYSSTPTYSNHCYCGVNYLLFIKLF